MATTTGRRTRPATHRPRPRMCCLRQSAADRSWSPRPRSGRARRMVAVVETLYDESDTDVSNIAGLVPPEPLTDGRFAPIAELGRGGMGVVYRCRDARMEREVAVKLQRDQ